MKHQIYNLFPSSVHSIELENFPLVKERVVSYIYKEKEKFPESVVKSNRGGWQSEDSYYTHDNILTQIVSGGLSYLGSCYKFPEMLIKAIWININKKNNFNSLHNHPECDLSGVLWINIPKGSGNFEFASPHNFTASSVLKSYEENFKLDTYNYPGYRMYPKEGSMLVFPSYLEHMVEPNKSDEDRISISFNIDIFRQPNKYNISSLKR